MRPRHPTAIALAASLACHATLMWSAVHFGRYEPIADAAAREPVAAAATDPLESPLGEHGGLGKALSSFDAPEPLLSESQGQDQPLLGLLPPGPLHDAPGAPEMLAMAEARPSLPAGASASQIMEALRPPPSALQKNSSAGEPALSEANGERRTSDAEGPTSSVQERLMQGDQGAPAAAESSQATAATDPGAPRDREVDLFAKEAVLEYRAGQAIARDGREFKIRGLRRGLAAFLEQAFLPRPIVVRYVLRVDEEGTPIDVRIEKSSGSEILDQQIRKDLFNSWFDPDPSRTGAELGRPFRFTIRIV